MIVSLPPPNTGICQLLPHSVKMSQCSDIKRARKVVFMSRVAVRMPADSQEATDLCTRKLSFPLAATSALLEIALCAGVPGRALNSAYGFTHITKLLTRCSHLVSSSQTLTDSCLWPPSVLGRTSESFLHLQQGPQAQPVRQTPLAGETYHQSCSSLRKKRLCGRIRKHCIAI